VVRSLLAEFEQYVKQAKKVTPEVLTSVQAIKEPYRLSDTIAAHLSLKLRRKTRNFRILDLEAARGAFVRGDGLRS
jgi:ATP-dependent Lon protease